MTYPWEEHKFEWEDYMDFMDTHVRVSVTINGERKGSFAIVDDGVTKMDIDTVMPDGTPLVFKIEGHPRTTDMTMTSEELIEYVIHNYKPVD